MNKKENVRPVRYWFISVLTVLLCLGGSSHAATTAEIVETYPAGDSLPINQRFYLRLASSSQEPARLWIRVYFKGVAVTDFGQDSSGIRPGKGEAQVWILFWKPEVQIDEMRVMGAVGKDWVELANWRGSIISTAAPADTGPVPAWVNRPGGAEVAQSADVDTRRRLSPLDSLLIYAFSACMLVAGVAGLGATFWVRQERMLVVPAGMSMGLVALNLAIDVVRDPTSHNLWPFEFAMAGLLGAGLGGLHKILHKLRRD